MSEENVRLGNAGHSDITINLAAHLQHRQFFIRTAERYGKEAKEKNGSDVHRGYCIQFIF
jgi:hypothetical protein